MRILFVPPAALAAMATFASTPLAAQPAEPLPFALPKADKKTEGRYFYGTRERVGLAKALFEAGQEEAAMRQLQIVEARIAETGDGFIFKSGKQITEEQLAGVRDGDGFKFGLRRSGHSGKSWTLATLARFYLERGDLDKAKRLVREIPSTGSQMDAAKSLLASLVKTGRLDQAAKYREEVLNAGDWDVKLLQFERNLRGSRLIQFAKESSFALFAAYREAGDQKSADALAEEMASWIKERNDSGQQPDIGYYREIALTLIQYYIDTDRQKQAKAIAGACVKKWSEYNMALIDPIMIPSFERQREQQLKVYKLALEQPKGGAFPITSGNLTRLPDEVTSRFIEIEELEAKDPDEACEAYFELGREFLEDPKRCKRYLQQIVQALTRLGDEPGALELMATLQENLPQTKIEGCPITAFQLYIDSYTRDLDVEPLLGSMRVQEDKLTTPERLWVSGVPLAKLYVRAGDNESALRLLDKASEKLEPKRGPYRMQGIISTRLKITGELRDEEVRKLVAFAGYEEKQGKKRLVSKQARLASVVRFFVAIDRLDWAEALLDRIAPAA